METCSVVLTFPSVNKILWCDYSNETSLALLLYGTICFSIFYKTKFGIFLEICFLAPLIVSEYALQSIELRVIALGQNFTQSMDRFVKQL